MSHFAFEPTDEEVQQWIYLILISRFSAVLMDQNGRLTDSQERFLDEATKDKVRRFVRHTDGREIENDIDRVVFLQGVAQYLGVEGSALTNVSLDGTRRYMDQIAEHLPGNDVERKRIRDKLGRKVNLATKVLACADNKALGCPGYIQPLYEFIRGCRLNDVKTS
jgi:hypothetical protein